MVVVGVEVAAHPIVVGVLLLDIVHLHPSRATPRCTHHFQVGIDGQYLSEHGDDIVQLVGGEGEVINALYVATGVVVVGMGVEVATSYGHAHITISHSVLHAEGLTQQFLASVGRHLLEVVGCGTGDGGAEAVEGLVTLVGIERERLLGRHVHPLGKVLADGGEAHGVVGCGDERCHSAYHSGSIRVIGRRGVRRRYRLWVTGCKQQSQRQTCTIEKHFHFIFSYVLVMLFRLSVMR